MSESTVDFDLLDNLSCNDDLQVNEDYAAPEAPKPVLPGRYMVQVLKAGAKADKNGLPVKRVEGGNEYPVLQLVQVRIIEPVEFKRDLYLFQDIDTKPFMRGDKLVSRAADLLRAIDGNIVTSGGTIGMLNELVPLLKGGCIFPARIDWAGYDKDYAPATIDEAGGKEALSPAELKSIYNAARVRGYRNIQRDNAKRGGPKGLTNIWRSPSGQDIECRPEITAFIQPGENYVLGPDKELLK